MPQTPVTSLYISYCCGIIVCAVVARDLAALPSGRPRLPLKPVETSWAHTPTHGPTIPPMYVHSLGQTLNALRLTMRRRVPMQVYDAKAAALHALDPARFTERLFVSTEDPDTVDYFDKAAAAGNSTEGGRSGVPWRAAYVKGVPRKPDRHGMFIRLKQRHAIVGLGAAP